MHAPLLGLLGGAALLGASAGGLVLAESGLSGGNANRPAPTTAETTATPAGTETPITFENAGGGPVNLVQAKNQTDGHFELKGKVQFVRTNSEKISPTNFADASSSCTDCQTLAIALQIVVYQQGSSSTAPGNAAVAVNSGCNRCLTISRAIQFAIPVADPKDIPPDVRNLAQELNQEIKYLESINSLQQASPADIEGRLNSVLSRFVGLGIYLLDARDQQNAGDATPTSSPTPESTAMPVLTATPTLTSTPAATSTAPSPTNTPAQLPSATSTETATAVSATTATPSATPPP